MEETDCVVVGAGVVGLAIARELSLRGREVLILEQHTSHGSETSSRNSEVIHSGLHYPRGSLKAVTCVRGRELLYDYCRRHGVDYRRCGKLIVASAESQIPALETMLRAAHDNGVTDVRLIGADEARLREPEISCVAALHCPSTGIVDSHGLMTALLGEAERHGAVLSCRTSVASLRTVAGRCEILIDNEPDAALAARWVVNAAGLGATALAARSPGYPRQHIPIAHLAKGNYFTLSGRAPFTHLVYPVPEPGGLGIHLTLDLAGQARFGPDVEWVNEVNYDVDASRAKRFYDAIRTYWPGIEGRTLQPAYAGVRPKISGPGEPNADFRVDGPETHGVPGLVSLFGIESPGLSAALAIAEIVANLIDPLRGRSAGRTSLFTGSPWSPQAP